MLLALAAAYINETMEAEALEVLEQWTTTYPEVGLAKSRHDAAPIDPLEDLTSRTEKVSN